MEMMKQCPHCHSYVNSDASYCSKCGYAFNDGSRPTPPPASMTDNPFEPCGPEGKTRGVAALFAILLGVLGVQYFYLGKTTAGILSILISLVSCGMWQIVTVIQGILMFTMTNEQFRQKYVTTPSSFPVF